MRVMVRLAIIAFLTCRVTATTLCEQPSAAPDNPYSYLVSYIAASVQIQHACELALQNGRPPMSENIGDTLLQLKRAKQALACAKQILSPYLQSTNHLAKSSAAVAIKGIETLDGGAQKEIELYKRVLDATSLSTAKRKSLTTAQFADQMSDIGLEEDSGWQFITKSTQGAFYAVVDREHAEKANAAGNNDWRRLLISSAQRADLLALLERDFGASVKAGISAQPETQTSVQTGAAFLYQALSQSEWKARDE